MGLFTPPNSSATRVNAGIGYSTVGPQTQNQSIGRSSVPTTIQAPALNNPAAGSSMASKPMGSTPGSSTGAMNSADMARLIASYGQQSMNQAPQLQAPPATISNSATPNTTIENTVVPALIDRAQNGTAAKQALGLSTAQQRANISGLLKEAGQDASRRGLGRDSGAESLQKTAIINQGQREMAHSADNIAYQDELAKDKRYVDAAGIAATGEGIKSDQQRIALAAYDAQTNAATSTFNANNNAKLSYDQANMARQDRIVSLITSGLF